MSISADLPDLPDVPDLTGPLAGRALDGLDLAVAEAMLLQALGPDSDAMRVCRGRDLAAGVDGGVVRVELTPLGRATLTEMASTNYSPDVDGWMELVSPGLVEAVVDEVGEQWRAEAELAVELAAAGRADDIGALVRLARDEALVVDDSRTLGQILADATLDPQLAALI